MPYSFHPDIYFYKLYENIPQYRESVRKMKLFFSGNINQYAYTNNKLEDAYNVINRHEIITNLLSGSLQKEIISITQETDFNHILNNTNYTNKIIFILTNWSDKQKQNVVLKIPISDWLKTLAKADFFLACPGVQIPFSHNVIEAMSVGTIPVIQYGNLFNPPLKHGVNCITYNTIEELTVQIEILLSMSQHDIHIMRKNVINYYETNLNMERYTDLILANPISYQEIYLFSEYSKLWEH